MHTTPVEVFTTACITKTGDYLLDNLLQTHHKNVTLGTLLPGFTSSSTRMNDNTPFSDIAHDFLAAWGVTQSRQHVPARSSGT